jgi:alpha-tubulin suppressor-like RCC1 family protein
MFSTGFNLYGRLGHGHEKELSKFTLIKPMKGKKVVEVKCGYFHSLCVTHDGNLYSWGYGASGRLG